MNQTNIDNLGIIRSNVINDNLKDSAKLMQGYGVKSFPCDYLDYLYSIHATDDELIADLRKALNIFKVLA